MANRLMHETSPYLQEHAHNPVDWYPWGQEALSKAQAENKPIFLSIGYSACHWCHVMARESFEDERVAAFLNAHFVSIKVDREERPDLDRIYMAAVQAVSGHGGWPMSVFLTPQGKPFFGGTYFPPVPRYGMASFSDVLRAVLDAWHNRRDQVEQAGDQIVAIIQRNLDGHVPTESEDVMGLHTLVSVVGRLESSYDAAHGGWGGAPKFPQPMIIEFLLRYYQLTEDARALGMAVDTLEAMARGGMYDQLGGGFHRYSVDDHWLVPHFEKMLYDNAQLARVYLHAWQVTGKPFLRTIAEETLDYVRREMTSPEGGFYSAQDADSEGEEGRFFLWIPEQIENALGAEAEPFMSAYGVTAEGNFEGRNILHLVGSWEQRAELAKARSRLLAVRDGRTRPRRDDKVLTSWNGLMLAAYAEAAVALGRADYLQVAENNAMFLLRALRRVDGRLWHTWKAGQARLNGYLDDYTYLIEGLLALYRATFDPRWFGAARELAEALFAHFDAAQGFYDTSDDHEALLTRPRELQDSAVPSGNAMATLTLFQLADLAMEPRYAAKAQGTLEQVWPLLEQYPLAFGQWLVALERALARRLQIAIVGAPSSPDVRALLEICQLGYHPNWTVAVGLSDASGKSVPLLRDKKAVGGQATAYVCVDATCYPPVTRSDALNDLLVQLMQ